MIAPLTMLVPLLTAVAVTATPQVGRLDVHDAATGGGAGCFFFLAGSEPATHVLIERDGLGWMRLDGEIVKLPPSRDFVIWPSVTGDELGRVYRRSETTKAELNIVVADGCGEREDNCSVTYRGTLTVTHGKAETTLKVEGYCAC